MIAAILILSAGHKLLWLIFSAVAIGLAFESQHPQEVKNVIYGPFKETTYGTALLAASFTKRPRADQSFAVINPDYYTDIDKSGKGHQWPTTRARIKNSTSFGATWDVDNVVIAWALAFVLGADTVTGVGPFTHTFKFIQNSNIMPVTSLYFEDTADVKYTMLDLAISQLQISGGASGPLSIQFSMMGSGKWTDGSVTLPGLVAPVYLFGSDTDLQFGPQGAPVSFKERNRGWTVTIENELVPNYAPGTGLVASFTRTGKQRATVQFQIAAKDVDDIRTLINNDTIQELDIITNSGASAQLTCKFPGMYFKGQLQASGDEEVWNIQTTEQEIIKSGANEIFQAVVTNSTATYLTAG